MFYSIFVHFNIVSLRIKYKKDYICNVVKLFVQENITKNRIPKYIFKRFIV
ncbi:unknown [Tannerella sp. CAG:118]|nr:unknown [Tannerella sp. CAG:118]